MNHGYLHAWSCAILGVRPWGSGQSGRSKATSQIQISAQTRAGMVAGMMQSVRYVMHLTYYGYGMIGICTGCTGLRDDNSEKKATQLLILSPHMLPLKIIFYARKLWRYTARRVSSTEH